MGLLWGNTTAEGVKIEEMIIPPHEAQTATKCVVGDWDLIAALQWGHDMGDWWLGWIHTHPIHLPVLSAQNICATNALGIHLGPLLPEGRAPVAVVQQRGHLKSLQTDTSGPEARNSMRPQCAHAQGPCAQ